MRIQPKEWGGESQASGRFESFDEIRKWTKFRELGKRTPLGHSNRLSRQLYSSMQKVRSWIPTDTVKHQHHGGIFNFDFSKDGSVLVAACEKRSVLIFDPLNGQLISSKDKAHNDCVNCVRFLDSRLFATCSDDTTVCLWDVRYMKHKIRTLQAHSNWVKNIEYDAASGLLVTSGFDGSIFTWDINRYSENEENYKRVFHTPGLMRMKLTPDASKLIVATGSGYLMVIHELDLTTLAQDLENFMPNMYRWMQQTNTPFPQAYQQNHVFTQSRNRVELISDFPDDNKADMIASLEVHPQGWCVVSRNTSTYEASEWTCVHDIQSPPAAYHQLPPGADGPSDRLLGHHPPRTNSSDLRVPPPATLSISHSEPQVASTEPSRTGSPAYVLSVSINDGMVSPPSISQNSTSTVTAGEEVEAVEGLLPHAFSEPTDLLSSSSGARYDLSLPVRRPRRDSDSDEEDEEEGEEDEQDSIFSPENDLGHIPRSSAGGLQGRSELYRLTASARRRLAVAIRGHALLLDGATSSQQTPTQTSSSSPNSNVPNAASESDDYRRASSSRSPSNHSDHSGSGHHSPLPNHSPPRQHPSSVSDVLPNLRIHNVDTGPDSQPSSGHIRFLVVGHGNNTAVSNNSRTSQASVEVNPQQYIYRNYSRLTHYIEELNVGRGFIKEVSFSNDGRMVCSPYGFGVRLLAFDSSCCEMCDCVPTSPVKLYPVTSNMTHTSAVVTTKFSPLHCMFVSGCLNGKVDFHQPQL